MYIQIKNPFDSRKTELFHIKISKIREFLRP